MLTLSEARRRTEHFLTGQMLEASLRGDPLAGSDAVLGVLHRKVRANRKRLRKARP